MNTCGRYGLNQNHVWHCDDVRDFHATQETEIMSSGQDVIGVPNMSIHSLPPYVMFTTLSIYSLKRAILLHTNGASIERNIRVRASIPTFGNEHV